MQHVKWLGNLHKKYTDCLVYGRYRELLLTNRQYAFVRFTQEQGLVEAVNNDEQEVNISIPVPFENKRYINLKQKNRYLWEGGRILPYYESSRKHFYRNKRIIG